MLDVQLLRKIRKEKRIKIKEVAKILGKSRNTISLWEHGRCNPTEAEIRLIAQFLNVSVGDISDLKELKFRNDNIEKQTIPGFNLEDFSQETATKLKNLYEVSVEQRAANTRLRNETVKYEIMLHNLPFIIYVKDKKLKYKYANDKFLDIAGQNYTKSNISGISAFDIFDFKDQANILQIKALEERVFLTKEKLSNQQIHIPGTFNRKIGLLTIVPILDAKEEVEEIIGSIEDITDTYEEQRRRKDLEAVTNKINHTLWIGETVNGKEESFRYTFISDNVSEIYGVEKQDIFKDNKLWMKIVHTDDIEMVNNWNIDSWEETDFFSKKIEYKINNPKKGVRWISSEVFREGVNKFYGVITDITEEKEKEREREAILQTLNAADDAIKIAKIKDGNKEHVYVNKANKDLYELPISKIKNNPDIWKDFLHPDDKSKILLIGKKKQEGHLRLNYKLLFPDGKIKYIEEDIFREVSDGVLYTGSIKRDVTEEKDAKAKLEMLQTIINKLDSCVVVTTSDKQKAGHFEYLFISDSIEKLLQIDKKVLLKDPFYLSRILHPEDKEKVNKWWQTKAFPGAPVPTSLEYRIILPDKTIKRIKDELFPCSQYFENSIRFAIITDITSLQKSKKIL